MRNGSRWLLTSLLALAAPGALLQGAPCSALDLPSLRSEKAPYFSADLATSLDAQGAPGLSVTITVAYDELQWLRLPAGFGAAAEAIVVFEPRRGGVGAGDSWQRRVIVPEFERTRAARLVIQEARSFRLPPGRYTVRVTVRDENSDESSYVSQRIEVPDYSRMPIGFADLELGLLDDQGAFLPVPTRIFGRNVERLAARATLFDRRAGEWPREHSFRYSIRDESGGEIVAGRRNLTVPRSAEPVVVRPDSSTLFVGNYSFEVVLEEGRSRWRVERSFEVEESGPPRGREFERMLEPLAFIARPEEIERLRSLTAREQAAGWDEFWRRRDPTPDTPRNETMLEFLRRVRYAAEHFQYLGPGWRSDMGRIYIKFGPPDQIDSRPQTVQSPQVEVWYYNLARRTFVFVDREGFGRYTVVSPTLE